MINYEHIPEIRIAKIETLNYKIDLDVYDKNENIIFAHKIDASSLEIIDEKTKLEITFSIKFGNKKQKSPFILLSTIVTFIMPSKIAESYIKDTEKKATLEEKFAEYILQLILDTSRGILSAKTEGTSLSKYIVPNLKIKPKDSFLKLNREESEL